MSITNTIESSLSEMKATDVVMLDVTALTSITDTIIICTGRSNRHIHSLAEKLVEDCKAAQISPLHVSGLESDEWIIVDCLDAIVHIMTQEARDFYQLEKIWSQNDATQQQS